MTDGEDTLADEELRNRFLCDVHFDASSIISEGLRTRLHEDTLPHPYLSPLIDSPELIVKTPTKVYRKRKYDGRDKKSQISTEKDFGFPTPSTSKRCLVEPLLEQVRTDSDLRTETVAEVVIKKPTEQDVSQLAVEEELVDYIYSSLEIINIETDTMEAILFKKPTAQDASQLAVKEEPVDHIYSSPDKINIHRDTTEGLLFKKEPTETDVCQLAVKEEPVDHIYSSPDKINVHTDTTEGLLFKKEPTETDVSQRAVKEEPADLISSSLDTERAVKAEINIEPTVIQPCDIQYMMRPCKLEPAETSKTVKNIPRGRELLVFYGRKFARLLGIDLRMYNAPRSRLTGMGLGRPMQKRQHTNSHPFHAQAQTKMHIEKTSQEKPPAQTSCTRHTTAPSTKCISTKFLEDTEVSIENTEKPNAIQKYEYDTCRKVFSWKSSSMSHLLTHTRARNAPKNVALTCTAKMTEVTVLNKDNVGKKLFEHTNIHTGKKLFQCVICNGTFNYSCHLTTHMRTHTGEKPYQCTVCNKTFIQSCHLTKHMRIHTGERPYQCTVCNKTFNQSSTITTHMRTHTGEKPYQCTVCNKTFNTSGNKTKHMRIHTGEEPYQCTVCNKTFNQSGTLTSHMRIHSGKKLFQCVICNRTFNYSNYLTTHMRTHTGEKPYQCTVCNKTFNQSSTLTTHMRTHTGEKPYQCTVCNKTFTTSGNLTKHMRIHTGEKR